MEEDSHSDGTTDVLVRLVVGAVVLLLSVFYLQYNRQAASRDAIAYAAKIRQQKSEANENRPNVIIETEEDERHSTDKLQKEAHDGKNSTTGENEKAKVEINIVPAQEDDPEEDEDLFKMNNNWRCACEGGFLPPGFGGVEAVFRMGTGECYHKQT